jgi:hypothetical protein
MHVQRVQALLLGRGFAAGRALRTLSTVDAEINTTES